MPKAEIFSPKIYHSLGTTVLFLRHETLTLCLAFLYHTPTYGKGPTLVLFFTGNTIIPWTWVYFLLWWSPECLLPSLPPSTSTHLLQKQHILESHCYILSHSQPLTLGAQQSPNGVTMAGKSYSVRWPTPCPRRHHPCANVVRYLHVILGRSLVSPLHHRSVWRLLSRGAWLRTHSFQLAILSGHWRLFTGWVSPGAFGGTPLFFWQLQL